MSDLTCSLKITGSNLKPATPPVTAAVIHPDSKGDVFLSATNAELHGSQLQLETRGELPDIGYWDKGDEWVSWMAQISEVGTFNVSATVATPNAEAGFVVEAGGEIFGAQAPQTGSWDKFQTVDIGRFQIIQPGELVVKVRAKDKATWKALNLNSVKLTLTGPVLPPPCPCFIRLQSRQDKPRKEQPTIGEASPSAALASGCVFHCGDQMRNSPLQCSMAIMYSKPS